MLQIPASTLRRYCVEFSSHLSDHATRQRKRRYTESDIAVLSRARELLSQGKTSGQADKLLGIMSSDNDLPDQTLALIPTISKSLTEALDTARALRAELNTVNATIQDHDKRMSDSERKIDELTTKLEQLERDHRSPWYKKLVQSITRSKLPDQPK